MPSHRLTGFRPERNGIMDITQSLSFHAQALSLRSERQRLIASNIANADTSFEVRQKLSRHRPQTLGQASRISGITPAAISLLLVHLKKGRLKAPPAAANEPASPPADAAA